MSKLKPIPVKMDEETHYKIKYLAASANLSFGRLLKLMADSLTNRLTKLLKDNDLKPYDSDLALVNLILLHDTDILNDEEFNAEIENLKEVTANIAKDFGWSKGIKFKDGKITKSKSFKGGDPD